MVTVITKCFGTFKGLSALFYLMLFLEFFRIHLGTRRTYCVVGVGRWWVMGRGWGFFSDILESFF